VRLLKTDFVILHALEAGSLQRLCGWRSIRPRWKEVRWVVYAHDGSPRATMWGEMTAREGDCVEQFHQQVIDTHIKQVGSGVRILTASFLRNSE
jgi:hypothetical protein